MLYEKIISDLTTAMKEKDKEKLAVLRMIKGSLQLEQINNKKEMTDEVVIDVLTKQIKMRKESIKEFERAERRDLIESYQREIDILSTYLPRQLTLEEVKEIIEKVFAKVKPESIKDLGNVMREVTPLVKGKFDMSELNKLIREKLN